MLFLWMPMQKLIDWFSWNRHWPCWKRICLQHLDDDIRVLPFIYSHHIRNKCEIYWEIMFVPKFDFVALSFKGFPLAPTIPLKLVFILNAAIFNHGRIIWEKDVAGVWLYKSLFQKQVLLSIVTCTLYPPLMSSNLPNLLQARLLPRADFTLNHNFLVSQSHFPLSKYILSSIHSDFPKYRTLFRIYIY